MSEIKMTHDEVMQVLPHRTPMLLVDTVEQLASMEMIATSFYIDPAMEIFKGHFPGDPVFPGVLSVECMAQAVDIMLMTADKYAGKTPLFLGINNVRFMKKILPGDTLTCRAEMATEREDKGIVTCNAVGYINGEAVVSGEITVAMR